MRKSIITISVLAILLASLIAGCTGSNTYQGTNVTGNSAPSSKLVIGTMANIVDINMLDADYMNYVRPLTTDGLLTYSENGTLMPGLADSWESDDLQNWTFHLAHNATFHDGSPVKAQDVKFSLEYLIEHDPNMKIRFNLVDTVEAPDDYTVIVHLKQPSYNFIVDVTTNLAVYPEKVFAGIDDPKNYNDINATIGTGPYKFVSFDKAAGIITLKAYDDYRYGKPSIDTIEIRLFKNEDTMMMMALQNGEIDTTYMYAGGIGYYYVPKLLKNDNIRIMMVKNIAVPNAIWFHTQKYPLNLTAFREAVSYAINYQEVNNLFTAGYGTVPNAGYLPVGSPGYIDTDRLTYDVNKSKALLDSIGFKDVDGDGYREYPNGTKFQPELLVDTDTSDVRLAETVKNYLGAVGINTKLKVTDKGTVSSILRQSKDYEIVISRTTNFGMMAYAGYGSLYIDSRNIGYSMVDDPEFQSMVDELLNTSDQQRRDQIGADLQKYYAAQRPVIPLYWCDYIQPYNAKFEGWGVDPIYGIISDQTLMHLHVVE